MRNNLRAAIAVLNALVFVAQAAAQNVRVPVRAPGAVVVAPVAPSFSAAPSMGQSLLPGDVPLGVPGLELVPAGALAPQAAAGTPAAAIRTPAAAARQAAPAAQPGDEAEQVPAGGLEGARSLRTEDLREIAVEDAAERLGRLFGDAKRSGILPTLAMPATLTGGGAAPVRLNSAAPRASRGPIASRADALPKDTGRDHKREPGVFSHNRLKTFENDPERYALTYLFGKAEGGAKAYPYAVGLAVHETMELVFKEIESGADPKSLKVEDALAAYDVIWGRLMAEDTYSARDGVRPSDYKRRGSRYIERRWSTVQSFTGKVDSLETAMHYSIRDPQTGKAFPFKGIPDRVTVEGKTLFVRDWKTHFNPPTIDQLKRDDYQLGLYVLGMMELFPERLAGKKITVAWDYKEYSQEIEVTPEYLSVVKDRILRVLHGIETFEAVVAGEKQDWAKRAAPDKRPKGMDKARNAVNAIGALETKLRSRKTELREINDRLRAREAGLTAYATKEKLADITGKTHSLKVSSEKLQKIPTSADEKAHEAVVEALKKAGLWRKYSKLDYAALREAALLNGYPDQRALEKVMPHLQRSHENVLKLEAADDASGLPGVSAYNLNQPGYDEVEAERGMVSASKLSLFERNPKDYALQYLFGVKNGESKSYELLVGLAVHETMEHVFAAMKGGKPSKDIKVSDVLKHYRELWKLREQEQDYSPTKGSRLKRADYIRKGEEYINAKFKQLMPFERLGEIIFLESRMHFTLTDPKTGKTYKFQGIPDRVMMSNNKVQIRDWKTHFVPRTEEEIRSEDFQLALYVLAMRQLYPGMMAGREVELVWDFKDAKDVVTIQATEEYLKEVEERVFGLLREIEKFTKEVSEDAAKWEKLAGHLALPKGITEARRWVDEMGRLEKAAADKKKEIEGLKAERERLAEEVLAFQRRTGHWTVETSKFAAHLQKKPVVTVPTKGKDAKAHAEITAALQSLDAWERYSSMDYAALKKAVKDEKNPDYAKLEGVRKLLETVTETSAELEPVAKEDGKKADDGVTPK